MKPLKLSHNGIGLIETLMIVLFISISIVALMRFQKFLITSTHYTQQQGDALILATKQMETLRDFTVINTTSGYIAYQDISSGTSTISQNGTSYTVAWTITTNTAPTYKILNVTVSWTDRSNTNRSINLVSRVASVDPANSSSVI
jgi:Tfp pilus assembly protein PilV